MTHDINIHLMYVLYVSCAKSHLMFIFSSNSILYNRGARINACN